MRVLSFILSALISFPAMSAELNNVTMADSVEHDGKKLSLNGMGLRKVYRFGIPVKVYVAGLYLEKASQDSDAIINSDSTKKIIMEFVRPVDRKSLVKAYKEGYEKNCQVECENKKLFSKIKRLVVSVRKKNRVTFTFEKDQVTMSSTGPNEKSGTVKSAALSKNMLALFINKKAPPTEEFRTGLLGSN